MHLKTFLFLTFFLMSCIPASQKSNPSKGVQINGVKVECPASGTQINCMPRFDEKLSVYCEPQAREWVMKNCKEIQYSD